MGFRACYVVPPPVHESDSESDIDLDDGRSSSLSVTERKHEYRSLKPNEIRLLVLNPGLPDEPIECSLEHYSANQAKPYEALSYVWGDTRDSSFIRVDGCPFKVSRISWSPSERIMHVQDSGLMRLI